LADGITRNITTNAKGIITGLEPLDFSVVNPSDASISSATTSTTATTTTPGKLFDRTKDISNNVGGAAGGLVGVEGEGGGIDGNPPTTVTTTPVAADGTTTTADSSAGSSSQQSQGAMSSSKGSSFSPKTAAARVSAAPKQYSRPTTILTCFTASVLALVASYLL